MNKIKINDLVHVHTGSHSGSVGKILTVNRKSNYVTIDGVGELKKCIKPSQDNPQGGFKSLLKPIHISNVSLLNGNEIVKTKVTIIKDDKNKNKRIIQNIK